MDRLRRGALGRRKIAGVVDNWNWLMLATLRGEPEQVIHSGNQFFVVRRPAPAA